MEFLKGIDLILSNSVIARWAVLAALSALTVTTVVLFFSNKGKDLEIVLLRTEAAKTADALYRQNQKIRELGEQARTQKKVMQQAVDKASQIAIENKKQLDDIKSMKLQGTCDEMVKQSLGLLKGKGGS